MRTNNSTISNYSERPQGAFLPSKRKRSFISSDRFSKHLHANFLGLPATDAYVRQFATTVRNRLDPTLKPHIEYSNEVWNYISQTNYAKQKV